MEIERISGKIAIAGGSGFLGVSLAHYLAQRGAAVVLLSRRPPKMKGPWQHVPWDGRTLGDWRQQLEGAVGLVNLAGRSVNCVKTPERQDEILRSRIESTRVLGDALRGCCSPPPVWVQMSTAHIYGDPPEVVCEEDAAFGYGLAPFVGRAWEEAYRQAVLPTQRRVIFRTSFVLGRDRGAGGGALAQLAMVTRFGLGGRIGSGKQGMSWIHQADLNRLFTWALYTPAVQGTYIASAPCPVSQADFMTHLRHALGVWLGLPAPEWLVRWGASWVLKSDPELALYGRYVRSGRLEEEGFHFQFPELKLAFEDLLSASGRSMVTSVAP